MSIVVPPFPGAMQFISLQQAIEMTKDYRKQNENILDPEFRNKAILPFSETFNREVFDTLLAQPGCEGIRFYYGMDDANKIHVIAVAVNGNNEDMIQSQDPLLIENSIRCPSDCPPSSVLNS